MTKDVEVHRQMSTEEFLTLLLRRRWLLLLTAVLGGAAGFIVAEAMFRARLWSRLDELTRVGKEAIYLAAGTVPLLAAAAFLEAVIARAPDRYLDAGFKLGVACVVLLLFVIYVGVLGWRKGAPPALRSAD